MMFRYESDLAGRTPRLVDDEIRLDQTFVLCEGVGQRESGLVVADEADEDAARAERRDVARHIAGAADLDLAVRDREHRGRRLRRNARDLAIDEVVEHEIADAEDGLLGDFRKAFFEVEHRATGSDRRDRGIG